MDKEKILFTLIGPPEAGKMALAEALAKALGDKIELVPRLTDKPQELIHGSAGYVRRVTPNTLRRRMQDGRLILTRTGEHISGFDRARLDRLLQKKHVILVTTEDGVRELKEQRNDAGEPKYNIIVIRVVLPRKGGSDSQHPPSSLEAQVEILSSGVGSDPTWAVREISRQFIRRLA